VALQICIATVAPSITKVVIMFRLVGNKPNRVAGRDSRDVSADICYGLGPMLGALANVVIIHNSDDAVLV